MKRIAIVALFLLAVAALAGVARPDGARAVDPPTAPERTVTVTGIGAVIVVPDRAQVSLGVETHGASAKAALAANANQMQAVIDVIRRAGGRDIATQYVSLSPRAMANGAADSSYIATNSVSATIAVARAGALIDAAVGAGANQVWGPTMSVSDQAKLYREALRKAVADARARAEALADAAGRRLGDVVSISESGGSPVPVFAKAAQDAATPVVPGPQETSAAVSVTFTLV